MTNPANHYSLVIDSPLGRLGVRIVDRRVQRLDYLGSNARLSAPGSNLERRLQQALENYFADPRSHFDVPLALAGTPFQQRVWRALSGIPSGATLTYGALAARLGSGARAVGNACRHNPVSIIVPCHRVVAANGMGGYSGSTGGVELARKRWLLQHENPSLRA